METFVHLLPTFQIWDMDDLIFKAFFIRLGEFISEL